MLWYREDSPLENITYLLEKKLMSLLLVSPHCERAVSLSGGSLRLSEVLRKSLLLLKFTEVLLRVELKLLWFLNCACPLHSYLGFSFYVTLL